jgi:hypothetical protein
MIVARVSGWPVRVRGNQRAGWGPVRAGEHDDAARTERFDLEIRADPGGFLLCVATPDGSLYADTWHPTLDEAREVAREKFGLPLEAWDAPPGERNG